MKFILIISIALIPTLAFCQVKTSVDSVNIRIHNKGRFFIKAYSFNVNGKEYKFADVLKGKFSGYQKMPYIYPNNSYKLTIVRKRLLQYDEWITNLTVLVDQIGDKEFTSGNLTVNIHTKKKKGHLVVEQDIIHE